MLRYNAKQLSLGKHFKGCLIMLDQKLLDEIVARLQKIDPLRIFFFGSQVTDTTNTDSDVDLLVIKSTVTSSIKEINEARKLLRGLGKAFDVIVSTPEEFDFYRTQVNSVHHAAANFGKLLYG
jgi:predicted nucleotidyltransferase